MKLVSIDIRRAQMRDAPDIADVHLAAWRATYQGIIPHRHLEQMIARRGQQWWQRAIRRGTHVIVIDFDGIIAGYATVGINRARTLPYEGEVYELYLLPEYQGVGLGRQIFRTAHRTLSEYGLSDCVIWVLEENATACAFYERLNGKQIARSTETFGERNLNKLAYAWTDI